jgi:hypothetical protein
LSHLVHYKYKTWLNVNKAVFFLRDKPLFKRMFDNGYSNHQFLKLIPHLKVIEKNVNEIVFCEEEFVHIVLNGRVALRYHEEDPLEIQ